MPQMPSFLTLPSHQEPSPPLHLPHPLAYPISAEVSRPSKRVNQKLTVFLAFLAALPLVLLAYGLLQDQKANHLVADSNRSASLRYKSLLVFAMTNPQMGARQDVQDRKNDTPSWQMVRADMAVTRRELRTAYPGPVTLTDAAWAAFDSSLRRTNTVDWRTANALRIAANQQTQLLATLALRQRKAANISLVFGALSASLSALVGFSVLQKLRQTEMRLGHEHAFLEAVLQTAGALVVVVDPTGRIVRFNRACETLSGYMESEVIGKIPWEFLIPPEEVEGVLGVVSQLRSGQYPNRYENHWLNRSGGRRRIAWTNTALTNGAGVVTFVIGTGIDITERHDYELRLSEANARLETLSLQDGLTGLANRRALDARLAQVCLEAMHDRLPLSLLILDVDYFKRFNDLHGHLAGDDVLKSVAFFLRQVVRDADFVTRYGGEEFVVILPKTSADAALDVAQRVCRSMEAANLSALGTITASVGAATWTPAMGGPDDLLSAADHALYFSKKRRNCAVHVDSIIEVMDA